MRGVQNVWIASACDILPNVRCFTVVCVKCNTRVFIPQRIIWVSHIFHNSRKELPIYARRSTIPIQPTNHIDRWQHNKATKLPIDAWRSNQKNTRKRRVISVRHLETFGMRVYGTSVTLLVVLFRYATAQEFLNCGVVDASFSKRLYFRKPSEWVDTGQVLNTIPALCTRALHKKLTLEVHIFFCNSQKNTSIILNKQKMLRFSSPEVRHRHRRGGWAQALSEPSGMLSDDVDLGQVSYPLTDARRRGNAHWHVSKPRPPARRCAMSQKG